MKPLNWFVTILAIVVLTVTISLLFWLRNRTARGLETGIVNTVAMFTPPQAILNEPTDPAVNFVAAETLVRNAQYNPFIRELILTKWLPGRTASEQEVPIVPYDLRATMGPGWRSRLAGMTQVPLEAEGRTYGFLYFDLDRSPVRSVNWAIGAATVALVTTLLLLLGRVHSQEFTILRVGTELEQRKQELIRLERLALAGQLTANLLHDLKKPVLNIRHRLTDLRDAMGDGDGVPPQKNAAPGDAQEPQLLDETEEQIDLFFQMLSDSSIEKFVRSDLVREEYVDINDMLRMATRLVHYERGNVELAEEIAGGLPPILAQPFRLVQVFSNLILNAYQAMEGKGRLMLRTQGRDGGVEVGITDSGPGIPPEIVATIFEPFFTTKHESEGTGLGLAISRLIIEELKGKIEVESQPGGPTTFRVWIPAESD